MAHRILHIFVHAVSETVECAPYARFTTAHATEIERIVNIGETEIGIFAFVELFAFGKRDHVGAVYAVVRIIERELTYTCLVGVRAYVTVGYANGHPYDALIDILAVHYLTAFAYQLEYPHLVLVGYGERLSRRCVTVFVGQRSERIYGFTGRLGALQGNVYQRAVVHYGIFVAKLREAAERCLGDYELVLVHVAYG